MNARVGGNSVAYSLWPGSRGDFGLRSSGLPQFSRASPVRIHQLNTPYSTTPKTRTQNSNPLIEVAHGPVSHDGSISEKKKLGKRESPL
jgi:hypothetical protein